MANDMSAYLTAMSQVKNIQIDPNSGQVTGAKNESILHAIDKVAPLKGNLKEALNNPLAKETAKHMSSIQDAYVKSFMNIDPEAIKKQKAVAESIQQPKLISVGTRPDEMDYMKALTKSCAKAAKKFT
jgi:hypothetical protein